MLSKIKAILAGIQQFIFPDPVSDLEKYILSKDPQTPGDVEFWTAEYDNEQRLKNRRIAME